MSSEARPIDVSGVSSGFFDSVEYEGVPDRLYSANQMSSIFDGVINDGVYKTIGGCLQVKPADEGLKIQVMPGRAWFDHTWLLNENISTLELKEAEIAFDRIDAVVIETNFEEETRNTYLTIVTGSPSDPPVKPILKHTDKVNQHALAYIKVRSSMTYLTDADIEHVVGTAETPYVTGILEVTSRDDWYAQWRQELDNFINDEEKDFSEWYSEVTENFDKWSAERKSAFEEWFKNIQVILDGNVAGRLQDEIDNIIITEFNRYYGLEAKTTKVNKENRKTVSIVETSDEAVATTTFEKKTDGKTITTVLIPVTGNFKYVKTVNIKNTETGKEITESYTSMAK